jgi:hypothetical protein
MEVKMDRSIKFAPIFLLVITSGLWCTGGNYFPATSERPPLPASAVVVAAAHSDTQPSKGRISSFFSSCFSRVKSAVNTCWSHCPRFAKDAIELTGLAAVDVAMYFYGAASNNTVLPVLTAYAIGQVSSEILDRHKYYLKILGYGAAFGLVELIKLWSGTELVTLSTSAIMAVVHTTFDEYAKMTGRKNTFTEDFRELPAKLQKMVIERLKRLARQVRAVKTGHDMPMEDLSMATAGMRVADMV